MTVTSMELGIGLIGAGIGYTVGERLVAFHRAAPLLCSLVFAVLAYLAAQVLAIAFFATGSLILLWLALRQWNTAHQAIITFAGGAGFQVRNKSRSYRRNILVLQREHERRVAAIEELGLPTETEEDLLEREETRYRDALIELTTRRG